MAQTQKQGPTVTLVNKAHQMAVFNLPFEILGSGYMHRQVVGSLMWVQQTDAKGRAAGLRKRARGGNKRLSKSMRLMGRGRPGATATGLPPAIVRCPDVAGAIKAGTVQVIQLDAAATAKQATALEAKAKADKAAALKETERLAAKRKAKSLAAAGVKSSAPKAATPTRARRARATSDE